MPVVSGDRISAALSTSLSAYNAAASNSLVVITQAEYNSILANVPSASRRGIDNFTALSALGTINDVVSTGTNFTVISPNSFIVAAAFSTFTESSGAIQITTAASSNASTVCLTGSSPNLSWATNEVKYFAVKQPTVNSGSNTLLGRNSSSGSVRSLGKATGAVRYNQTAALACGQVMAIDLAWSPALQVIATTTKSW